MNKSFYTALPSVEPKCEISVHGSHAFLFLQPTFDKCPKRHDSSTTGLDLMYLGKLACS